METQVNQNKEGVSMDGTKSWLKRIGIVGFAFFLIKGLVWLAIFLGIGKLF